MLHDLPKYCPYPESCSRSHKVIGSRDFLSALGIKSRLAYTGLEIIVVCVFDRFPRCCKYEENPRGIVPAETGCLGRDNGLV